MTARGLDRNLHANLDEPTDWIMRLRVGDNVQQIAQFVADTQSRRVPFSTVYALTQVAKAAQAAVVGEMRRVLSAPRAWTLNSLRTVPATRQRPTATLDYREFAGKGTPAGIYLRFLEAGSQRRAKRFELALIRSGAMPRGMYAAPSRTMPLDANGNIPGPVLVRILSHVRSFGEGGYRANLSRDRKGRRSAVRKAGGQYFAVPKRRGKLAPGIYWRAGDGKIQMAIAYVTRAQYRRIFRFYDVAGAAATRAMPGALAEGMAKYPPRA